jgi:hypothetical protein
MVFLSQVLPFSMQAFIQMVIDILLNGIIVWLSAQLVTGRAKIQNAFIFSILIYFILVLLNFVPIPSVPFVSISIAVEVLIKALLAMKLFSTSFSKGICIAAVQMLLGFILILPF